MKRKIVSASWLLDKQFSVKPEVFAAEVENIRDHGQEPTAEAVLGRARPKKSPIHAMFEWDDRIAANRHRLAVARNALRSIRVVIEDVKEPVRYVHIAEANDGDGGYVSTLRISASEALLSAAIRDSLRMLRSAQARLSSFREMAATAKRIGAIADEVEQAAQSSDAAA